jgi:hypothetical protein
MIESRNLIFGDYHNPGPGFIPFLLGFSLAGLSLLSFLSPDRKIKEEAFWNNWLKGKTVVQIFAGLAAYLILLKPLGFCIDTFLLLLFLTKVSGIRGYAHSILISFVVMAVIYIIFYRLLIIPFPKGILGL